MPGTGKRVLIAIIAVIGVTMAIVTPKFNHYTAQKPLTACKSNLKNIGTGEEMYSTDSAGLYAPSLSTLAPNYLMYTVPTCPSVGRDTYSASYKASSTWPARYTIWCGGRNHIQAGEPANYPQFNSTQGLVT